MKNNFDYKEGAWVVCIDTEARHEPKKRFPLAYKIEKSDHGTHYIRANDKGDVWHLNSPPYNVFTVVMPPEFDWWE